MSREGLGKGAPPQEISTARLRLRPWREEDRGPLAAMCADPRVMEFFPNVMTREESDAMFDRMVQFRAERGFGLWAVEIPGVTEFAGLLGLTAPRFEAHFTPCVEIGWRLCAEHWGRGYATEGAKAALEFGFEQLGLEEIVSLTTPQNVRSWRVMEKIGMKRNPAEDFLHPMLPAGHPLSLHVLYRLRREDWRR